MVSRTPKQTSFHNVDNDQFDWKRLYSRQTHFSHSCRLFIRPVADRLPAAGWLGEMENLCRNIAYGKTGIYVTALSALTLQSPPLLRTKIILFLYLPLSFATHHRRERTPYFFGNYSFSQGKIVCYWRRKVSKELDCYVREVNETVRVKSPYELTNQCVQYYRSR